MKIFQIIDQYNTSYSLLTTREKTLLMISSLAATIALLFLFVLEPMHLKMQVAQQQYTSELQIAVSNTQSRKRLQHALSSAPEVALEERISDLQFQYDDLKEELYGQQLAIVSATVFNDFLKRILSSSEHVTIDNIEIISTAFAGDDEDIETQDSIILKQAVQLTIRATDYHLHQYLAFLEDQPISLNWNSMHYSHLSNIETNVVLDFHLFSVKE
jgi:hypothetical protein